MFVIGISGVTCSGKSTIARRLVELYPGAITLCQDTYFFPEDSPRHVKIEEVGHNNWEILTALDMDKMRADVQEIIQRGNVEGDKFELLVLDGFLLLNDPSMASMCDLKVYVDVSYEECLRRRSARTYDPPDVPGYFEKVVWPHALVHRSQVLSSFRDLLLLDGSQPSEFLLKSILSHLPSQPEHL